MKTKKGEKVLITGASTGIGFALCDKFASEGYDLIMVSRDEERLNRAKLEIQKRHGVDIVSYDKDLSEHNAAEELYGCIKDSGLEIDILVNNAGFGACGEFIKIDTKVHESMIRLNINSLTVLSKLCGVDMAERGRGKILNVASTGSFQPGPYIAAYYASKAYVLSLTEALREELKDSGIGVSALCPGATRTQFCHRAKKKDMKSAMTPEVVAEYAYIGLTRNKGVIVPGYGNKVGVLLSKFLPRSVTGRIIGKTQKRLHDTFSQK